MSDSDKDLTIERTADGSATLYIAAIDEHYHSTKGALAESRHVYVDMCWRKAAAQGADMVRVFEVGFGTGLNAALTAETAMEEQHPTIYYSIELRPLDVATTDNLGYGNDLRFYSSVNAAEWGKEVEINPYFTIVKIVGNFLEMPLPGDINAVYFDAFAPEKQPEMWSEEMIWKLYESMASGGVLSTYCAKGIIRRRLQSAGFNVERLPGPVNGKREILRAVKPATTV